MVVCTNRDQGSVTPIYRTWPERFAWGHIPEIEHFVHCIQTETPPQVRGEDGRWAVAGVLAGTKSFLEERSVYLREVLEGESGKPCLSSCRCGLVYRKEVMHAKTPRPYPEIPQVTSLWLPASCQWALRSTRCLGATGMEFRTGPHRVTICTECPPHLIWGSKWGSGSQLPPK